MEKENYILAAIVGIVAVTGLVVLLVSESGAPRTQYMAGKAIDPWTPCQHYYDRYWDAEELYRETNNYEYKE